MLILDTLLNKTEVYADSIVSPFEKSRGTGLALLLSDPAVQEILKASLIAIIAATILYLMMTNSRLKKKWR